MTGGSNVPTTPSLVDEQDFLPTTVIVTMPACFAFTETDATPFLPVLTILLIPGPTRRTRAPATGLPAAVSLIVTFALIPAGIDFWVTVTMVQTAGAFSALGFGLGFGFATGGVNGGWTAGGGVVAAGVDAGGVDAGGVVVGGVVGGVSVSLAAQMT